MNRWAIHIGKCMRSGICMVSDVRDEDIHEFAKKLVKGAGAIWMAENRG